MYLAYSRVWIDGTAVDIKVVFSQHFRTFVNCSPRPIKYTAKHVLGDTDLQVVAREFYLGLPGVSWLPVFPTSGDLDLLDINSCCAFENLNVFSSCP